MYFFINTFNKVNMAHKLASTVSSVNSFSGCKDEGCTPEIVKNMIHHINKKLQN